LLEDMVEVADRLMIVEDEDEPNAVGHRRRRGPAGGRRQISEGASTYSAYRPPFIQFT
jgi:hypothetical protein